MQNLPKKIMISAGEASGDMHAANLIKEVLTVYPSIEFYGMGSTQMRQAGTKIIVDSKNLSIIGGMEIVSKIVKILRSLWIMRQAINNSSPDLLILVDYPGFNLQLAKIAKKAGVKVLYFISPKVWAWHQSRVKNIKKYVDMLAVIFPFEVDFYKKWGIPAKFVGNPLLQFIKEKSSVAVAKARFGIKPGVKVVGLFPGSRLSEIKRLLPIMLATAQILKDHDPNIHILLSQASSINGEIFEPYLQLATLNPQVIAGQNYDVMQVCDAIIAASGTATLEIALLEIPLVIIYKLSRFEAWLARRWIKIPFIGLCNILANKKIVPELLQDDATPETISAAIKKILYDKHYCDEMVNNLKMVKNTLESTEQKNLPNLVIEMLNFKENKHAKTH